MKKAHSSAAKPHSSAETSRRSPTPPARLGKTGSSGKVGGPLTVELALIESMRDQAQRDADSAAKAKGYAAAANWQAWAQAYDHLLVMVRSQS